LELDNRLPFSAFAFRQFDRDGGLDCVVAMRGTFLHRQGEVLDVARIQEPFQWEDVYDGDPHAGIMLRQSDLVPEKPGTDVTFIGDAYAPDGRPARRWDVSLEVGALQKRLSVSGERFWEPVTRDAWAGFSAREPKRVLKDWRLREPAEALTVPVAWNHAYGGAIARTGEGDPATADVEPNNPLGCGIVNLDMPGDAPVAAPRLAANDADLSDWRQTQEPQGFGPISPWWRFRQQYAGTYDDDWLDNRHPLLPEDFDPRFWQCAHPDLIATPHLNGDEAYRLTHLHANHPVASGRLPGWTFGVECRIGDIAQWHVMALDGVHFDWRTDDLVLLTWRVRFPLAEAAAAKLLLTRIKLTSAEKTNATVPA
jgi:hypothetical protein